MAEVKTFRCDGPGCFKLKGDASHWYQVRILPDQFWIGPWDSQDAGFGFMGGSEKLHVCSESCAAKKLSEVIGAKTPR
jgi:hypothetical protein